MKSLLTIFVFLLFSFQVCFAQQVDEKITAAWTDLKTQLQRRAGVITNLVKFCADQPNTDKQYLDSIRIFSSGLVNYIDTMKLRDSLSITIASEKNRRLIGALARNLVLLEGNKDLRAEAKLGELMMQLEGSENRIQRAKLNYNSICREYKRTDLIYGTVPADRAPEVKF